LFNAKYPYVDFALNNCQTQGIQLTNE